MESDDDDDYYCYLKVKNMQNTKYIKQYIKIIIINKY